MQACAQLRSRMGARAARHHGEGCDLPHVVGEHEERDEPERREPARITGWWVATRHDGARWERACDLFHSKRRWVIQQGRNGESTPGFQNGGAGASGSAGTSGGMAPSERSDLPLPNLAGAWLQNRMAPARRARAKGAAPIVLVAKTPSPVLAPPGPTVLVHGTPSPREPCERSAAARHNSPLAARATGKQSRSASSMVRRPGRWTPEIGARICKGVKPKSRWLAAFRAEQAQSGSGG